MTKPNILGLVRIHEAAEALPPVLAALAEHVDETFVLAHNASDEVISIAKATASVTFIQLVFSRWKQSRTLHEMFQLANRVKPNVVIYPDEDEILPDHFAQDLKAWMIDDHAVRPTMAFPYFYCWNDVNTIVAHRPYRTNYHCKVCAWHKGLDFRQYAGWCFAREHYKKRKYRGLYPLRHLCYMTRAMRDRRLERREKTMRGEPDWWSGDHPRMPVMPYDPALTWRAYSKASKKWKSSIAHSARRPR